jgi:hypothetical protein
MYMSGYVDIDPSHLTRIRLKPTKGFRRFAEIVCLGLLSEKEEQETFTAIAILQEINVALRSLNITDVVRFTKDDEIIYDDQDGRDTDDMGFVLKAVSREEGILPTVFESLSLLLEHHLPDITLIIDVRIRRNHIIGGYPIQIAVNGLSTEFRGHEDDQSLNNCLEQSFVDENAYQAVESKLREQFDKFMRSLELAVRQKMMVDDVRYSSSLKILRPINPKTPDAPAPQPFDDFTSNSSPNSDPVFQRYSSNSDAFAYCWLWSSFMHSHGTHVHDATLVDDRGGHLLTVGPDGFNAGESTALDPDTPFAESDALSYGKVQGEISDSSVRSGGGFFGDDTSSGSGWLSIFGQDGGGDSGDHGGGDSGSSCSSCGGGCSGD